jgi:hypothetical protein
MSNLEAKVRNELKGVGGWLAIFILYLSVLSPLVTIFYMVKNRNAKHPGESLVAFLVTAALVVYSVIVGIRLLWIRSHAVRGVKIFAIVMFALTVISAILFNRWTFRLLIAYTAAFGQCLLLFLYFSLSKRVKSTYGAGAKDVPAIAESSTPTIVGETATPTPAVAENPPSSTTTLHRPRWQRVIKRIAAALTAMIVIVACITCIILWYQSPAHHSAIWILTQFLITFITIAVIWGIYGYVYLIVRGFNRSKS